MEIGLDGIYLGTLTLSWSNLTLILGVTLWITLARFTRAEWIMIVVLLVARLWAALPGLSVQRPIAEHLLDIIDLRRGDWAWGAGLLAGALSLIFVIKQSDHKIKQEAIRAALLTVLITLLPQLIRPTANAAQANLPNILLPRLAGPKAKEPAPLPKARVLSFWATWCGPCRSELPLLKREIQRGQPIELINVGESPETIARFLDQHHPKLSTWYASQQLSQTLQVRGFPTTIVINAQGQVVARHLGVLSAAQLKSLIKKITD